MFKGGIFEFSVIDNKIVAQFYAGDESTGYLSHKAQYPLEVEFILNSKHTGKKVILHNDSEMMNLVNQYRESIWLVEAVLEQVHINVKNRVM